MLARLLTSRLPRSAPPRRLVVLTGARQVGKTTLARELYGEDLLYLNLDSSGERRRLAGVPAEGWAKTVGPAILDEVHKTPNSLEKVKWAYDNRDLDFSVLLGSSRILLLDRMPRSGDATRGRSNGRAASSASAIAPVSSSTGANASSG